MLKQKKKLHSLPLGLPLGLRPLYGAELGLRSFPDHWLQTDFAF